VGRWQSQLVPLNTSATADPPVFLWPIVEESRDDGAGRDRANPYAMLGHLAPQRVDESLNGMF
jgi:hypothetical protein